MNSYLDKLTTAARTDPVLTRQFLLVAGFIERPESFFKPSIVWRVLFGSRAAKRVPQPARELAGPQAVGLVHPAWAEGASVHPVDPNDPLRWGYQVFHPPLYYAIAGGAARLLDLSFADSLVINRTQNPRAPFLRHDVPGRRFPFSRSDRSRGFFLSFLYGLSDDGGLDDVDESLASRFSSRSTRALNPAISRYASASRAASSSCGRAASSSADGRPGTSGTAGNPGHPRPRDQPPRPACRPGQAGDLDPSP